MSVGGFCADDYAETCARLDDIEAIELNLSCPNVDEAADSPLRSSPPARGDCASALREALRRASRRSRGRARRRRGRRPQACRSSTLCAARRSTGTSARASPAAAAVTPAQPSSPSRCAGSAPARRRRPCRSSAWEGSPRAATRSSFSRAERPTSRSARALLRPGRARPSARRARRRMRRRWRCLARRRHRHGKKPGNGAKSQRLM